MKSLLKATSICLCLFSALAMAQDEVDEAFARFKSATATNATLQKGCEPELHRAAPTVPRRGTVVIFHGFTACPQQERELAERLAAQGYDVLLPLLPGHGRVQEGGKDNINDLPTLNNWREAFFASAHAANDFVRALPGERVIGGVSVGGELALLSMLEAPELYQKGIFYSPFFAISRVVPPGQKLPPILAQADAAKRLLLDRTLQNAKSSLILAAAHGPLKDLRWSWGKGCDIEERRNGRAGICDFKLTNLAAAQALGQYLAKNLKPLPAPTQFLGVERDGAADSTATVRMHTQLKNLGSGPSSLCLFDARVNHSLLSRYDSPKQNKFWIESLMRQSVDFITRGARVPTTGMGRSAEGQPYCRVDPTEDEPKEPRHE